MLLGEKMFLGARDKTRPDKMLAPIVGGTPPQPTNLRKRMTLLYTPHVNGCRKFARGCFRFAIVVKQTVKSQKGKKNGACVRDSKKDDIPLEANYLLTSRRSRVPSVEDVLQERVG